MSSLKVETSVPVPSDVQGHSCSQASKYLGWAVEFHSLFQNLLILPVWASLREGKRVLLIFTAVAAVTQVHFMLSPPLCHSWSSGSGHMEHHIVRHHPGDAKSQTAPHLGGVAYQSQCRGGREESRRVYGMLPMLTPSHVHSTPLRGELGVQDILTVLPSQGYGPHFPSPQLFMCYKTDPESREIHDFPVPL